MGKRIQPDAIGIVAKRYSATRSKRKRPAGAYLEIADKRVAVEVLRTKPRALVAEPRLRFDRVAVGLIKRLRASLSGTVPDGRTVVVTMTAPIRQDSKTGAFLEAKLRELLAARRAWLKTTICGNRTEVRVLKGGSSRTSKLIGFVHNPKPDPAVLFDASRSLLAVMGSRRRSPVAERWLVIDNQDDLSPVKTYGHVCAALRASSVFKRILVAHPGGHLATLPGL